jgi:hypothetical protein
MNRKSTRGLYAENDQHERIKGALTPHACVHAVAA